jgi:hemolysin III
MMDILPIVVLTLGVSIYMWWHVLKRKIMIVVVFLFFTGLLSSIQYLLEGQDRISAGYFIRGTMLFLPCLLYLRMVKYEGVENFVYAVVFFVVALFFRFVDDKISILPMGTHFLWHLFCAAGAYELGVFLLRNRKINN